MRCRRSTVIATGVCLVLASSLATIFSPRRARSLDRENPINWRLFPPGLWEIKLQERLQILDAQLRSYGVFRSPSSEIRSWHVPLEQAQALKQIVDIYTRERLDGSTGGGHARGFTACDVSEQGLATSSSLFRAVLLFFAGADHVNIIDEVPRISSPLATERTKVVERKLRTQFHNHVEIHEASFEGDLDQQHMAKALNGFGFDRTIQHEPIKHKGGHTKAIERLQRMGTCDLILVSNSAAERHTNATRGGAVARLLADIQAAEQLCAGRVRGANGRVEIASNHQGAWRGTCVVLADWPSLSCVAGESYAKKLDKNAAAANYAGSISEAQHTKATSQRENPHEAAFEMCKTTVETAMATALEHRIVVRPSIGAIGEKLQAERKVGTKAWNWSVSEFPQHN